MGEHALPDNVYRTHYDSGLGIQEFQVYNPLKSSQNPLFTSRRPGLKVVLKNNDFQGSATYFNVIVDCGSRNEKLDQLGGAHLLEHACFLGLGGTPSGDVKQYFWSSQGARDNNNAFTTVNAINYSCETEPEHYNKVLHTLSQMLSGANLRDLKDGKYLTQEIQNVVSEHERSNSASSSARRTVVAATSMVNTALGLNNARPTIGDQAVYTKMTANDLRNLHRQMFCPSRATLVVCGLQDAAGTFMSQVAKTLGSIPINTDKAPLQQPRQTIVPSLSSGQRMQLIQSGNAATYLAMAVPYPSMAQGTHKERAKAYAQRLSLDVLHELILPSHSPQSGLLKPLFDQGLVYDASIMPPQSGYASPAVMLLAIPSDLASEAQRVAAVQGSVQYLLQTQLPNFTHTQGNNELLQAAKSRLKAADESMTQGNIAAISEALLQGVRYRDPAYFFKRNSNLDYVTPQTVAAASRMWDASRLSVVVHSQHDSKSASPTGSGRSSQSADAVWSANRAVLNQSETLRAKDTTRDNTYVNTDPTASSFASMIKPLALDHTALQAHKNVTVLSRDIRPLGLTEVRVSYPHLGQRQDNHEQIAVTCDAINRQINEAMQQRMAPEAHVRLQATPTATALHVTMQVRTPHAASAVKQLQQTLLETKTVVSLQNLEMLVSSHMALGRGNEKTDAKGWAEHMTMSAMFNKVDVQGYTRPDYAERLRQLAALANNVESVQDNLVSMATQASHAHVINDEVGHLVRDAILQHMRPTGSRPSSASHAILVAPPKYGVAGVQARDIANTPELMVHAAVPLTRVSIQNLKDDMRLRVCCETLNASLGNSFAGRLMRTMRAEHGLTYGTTSSMLFGEMLHDKAHPCLYFTATLKPKQFDQGMKLMQDTVRQALVLDTEGAVDLTSASSARDEFNFAHDSLKTHWTRSSMSRDVASALLTSMQMRNTDYDERARLLGVNNNSFSATSSVALDFEQYKQCMRDNILPKTGDDVNMYVSVVGTGASAKVAAYTKSGSVPVQVSGNAATLKLRFRL